MKTTKIMVPHKSWSETQKVKGNIPRGSVRRRILGPAHIKSVKIMVRHKLWSATQNLKRIIPRGSVRRRISGPAHITEVTDIIHRTFPVVEKPLKVNMNGIGRH